MGKRAVGKGVFLANASLAERTRKEEERPYAVLDTFIDEGRDVMSSELGS